MERTEGRISEFDDGSIEIVQLEEQRTKTDITNSFKKLKLTGLYGTI